MLINIEEILSEAVAVKASDVHITVGAPPKMRLNGRIVDMNFPKLMAADTLAVLISVLSEQQRDIFEERGEYDMSYSVKGMGNFRVNAFKQKGTVAMVFRIVGKTIPEPDSLGLPKEVVDLTERKQGLVIVTGPSGSGKSTVLASLLDYINTNRAAHIITVEDPIEYIHSHRQSIVHQREVGIDTASYASAIRSALREDPDVIYIGELKDAETISLALSAAETGRLVFSSLPTGSVVSTIDRILGTVPDYQHSLLKMRLAGALEAVISRQLLHSMDGGVRIPALEILFATPRVRELIREGNTEALYQEMKEGKELGMVTMEESLKALLGMHNWD